MTTGAPAAGFLPIHFVRAAERAAERLAGAALGILLAVLPVGAGAARGDQIAAVYSVSWAGLPAGRIRLELSDGNGSYRDEIEIRTEGLPHLVTRFRGTALTEGRLAAGRPPEPSDYDARYDLRKRRNSRISMRFVARGDTIVAERGAHDTSRKPPLAEGFRRGAVDPMTALERIRAVLRAGPHGRDGAFTIPVYDGARRFDVVGHILPKTSAAASTRRIELTLRPIAGFKGESSEDGDPDDAPRPVMLTLTDDLRLLPLEMTVRVFFLPLIVRLDHLCTAAQPCRE